MKIWRMGRGGRSGCFVLDRFTLQSLAVTPDLDAWVKDPSRQEQALELYKSLGEAPAKLQDLQKVVKPRLQEAFRQGQLIAIPSAVFTGSRAMDPADAVILRRADLTSSTAFAELDYWLSHPLLRPLVMEMYACVGGQTYRQWTTEDLYAYVKPQLRQAFQSEELIAIDLHWRAGWSTDRQSGASAGQGPPERSESALQADRAGSSTSSAGKTAVASGSSKGPVPTPGTKQTWIEIVLRDEEGNPVPNESYRLVLPDGSVRTDKLDDKGGVRIDGIDPGACQICFPELDGTEWRPL